MDLILATRLVEARPGRGEDRIAVVVKAQQTLIVVADGAGGVAKGAEAAEIVCGTLTSAAEISDWSQWLMQQDAALLSKNTGQAAAIGLSVSAEGVAQGASVGDCECWLFDRDRCFNLTEQQVRKPMLGDGGIPVGFSARLAPRATLVVATDGLWKYIPRARIAEAVIKRPLEDALTALVDGVRLRSGTLQDDVAIVMCEMNEAA
jgi:serine/threonine protein phosphatase PrpC